jgi:predicted nucleic acid-binding protein
MNNSSIICVDAGLVVRRVAIPQDAAIQAVWEHWETRKTHLIAPTLLRYEVTNALYQYQKAGALSAVAAYQALRAAFVLPLHLAVLISVAKPSG